MPFETSQDVFEQMVAEAINRLPDRWRETINQGVPVQIVPRPPASMLAELEMEPDDLLLGLYEGIPETEFAEEFERVPDRIWLFKEDIETVCESLDDVREEIRVTLLHELGHHFGLDEDDLERLGYA